MRGIRALASCVILAAGTAAGISPVPAASTAAHSASTARLEVPSLHLSVRLKTAPCEVSWGPSLPPSNVAFFSDCSSHGFYGIVGRLDGALRPLVRAPGGTVVHWSDDEGRKFTRTLTAGGGGADQYPDGTWPGHGVPPGMPLFMWMRQGNQQVERQGYRDASTDDDVAPLTEVVITTTDHAVEVQLQEEHAENLDRRVTEAHFEDSKHFSFKLSNMRLSARQTSARYERFAGAVSVVRTHGDERDLIVTVAFRHRMSTFQVGVGGGFLIEVSFG
jgi:hypothetical protein